VTGRVLAIVEAVSAIGVPATLAELTRTTGIPKPTARRIADDLTQRGLLARVDRGYGLGGRLAALRESALAQRGVRQLAVPYLADLQARTGATAWMLAARDDDTVSTVEYTYPHAHLDTIWVSWPIDASVTELAATSAGRLLLADRPHLLDELFRQGMNRMTPFTMINSNLVRDRIRKASETGLDVEHEEATLGWCCVAARVTHRADNVSYVIGVAGQTHALAPERHGRALRRMADELAGDLRTRTASA